MPKKKNDIFPGLKLNNLTVIEIDKNSGGHCKHYYWLVQCDCGNIIKSRSCSIRKGNIKCNKCFSGEDLTGKIFGGKLGKILVIGFDKYDFRYNRRRSMWKYKCLKCGRVKSETGDVIKRNNISTCGDTKCIPKGVNHPKYNPNSKQLYARNGQRHRDWSKSIFIRDNYKCVICGCKNKIQSHHLNGWNWDNKNKFNINNGITLCSGKPNGCHYKFHKKYGSGNNTFDQFLEYIKDNKELFNKLLIRKDFIIL